MIKLKEENQLLINELEILSSLMIKIQMGMDIEHFFNEIITTLREKIPFDGCNFALIHSDGFMRLHRIDASMISKKSKLSEELLEKIYNQKIDYKISSDWASIAARENREVYLPEIDINEYSGEQRDFIVNYGITGLYYLPIAVGMKVYGTIRFHNYSSPMILSEFEKNLIRRRTTLVAKAIENFYLYKDLEKKNKLIHDDLKMAEKLQRNLIPQSYPAIDGISISARYIPMIEVGGDYYDFIHSPQKRNNEFGVLITDASGHGVSAAFIATMLKMSFQNRNVYKWAAYPGKVLQIMNESITNKIDNNFVTALYAYFDLNKRSLRIANAGHNPLYRINRDTGKIVEINSQGKPLGILKSIEYKEIEISIDDTDRFLFYTDGLVEAMDEKGVLFEDILKSVIHASYTFNTNDFLEEILKSLRNHSLYSNRSNFDDDISIIVVDIEKI